MCQKSLEKPKLGTLLKTDNDVYGYINITRMRLDLYVL